MIACGFDEANVSLGPPDGLSEDEVHTVRAFRGVDEAGHTCVVTCWRATPEEIQQIARTGRVWMVSLSGMMPVKLQAEKPEMELLPERRRE